MIDLNFLALIKDEFYNHLQCIGDRLYCSSVDNKDPDTVNAFSKKWGMISHQTQQAENLLDVQKEWYLSLYGFKSEAAFKEFLQTCHVIIDAGAGNCGKASWFAKLSPNTMVIAADISQSVYSAATYYNDISNLFFLQCDIGNMPFFKNNIFDFVNCDQVIHHTPEPETTFKELVRILKNDKQMTCYVYRKKALPRELLDTFFREHCKTLTHEQLVELSQQLTELGKRRLFVT